MKKWTKLGEAKTPDGETLTLYEQDGHFSIRLNGSELMSTRRHHSEDELARLGCEGLASGAKILIGGLGFGFTLKAALAHAPAGAEITVAELFPAVVEWNDRTSLAGAALKDPRVRLHVGNVEKLLSDRAVYDSILLDVDNGPEAFTVRSNSSLYSRAGLEKLKASLKPGGKLAVWSAFESKPFEKALIGAGFRVTVPASRAHVSSGPRHRIFLARR